MIKNIFLISLLLVFLSCESSGGDDTQNPQNDKLTLELVADNTNTTIDQIVSFEVKTNKPFGSITISEDNFETEVTTQSSQVNGFGTSMTLYVNTANIGDVTHSIRVKDVNDASIEASSAITFTVEKGNAVHIKEILVNNFYDKDNTWDTEFSGTDPNRLADVFFAILKPHIGTKTGTKTQRLWYKSITKENQGDLKWDLSQENLYVDPNTIIQFALADDDGGGIGQDLLLGPPFEKDINLSQYSATTPNNINLEDSAINLDVDFTLEWSN